MVPTLKDLVFLILGADGWVAGHLEILLQGECRVVLHLSAWRTARGSKKFLIVSGRPMCSTVLVAQAS